MRPGGVNGRRSVAAQVPRAVTTVLPVVLKEPASGTGRPSHQKPVRHTASTTVVVGNGLYLGPHGAGRHMTRPAPGVGSCLHHLSHCVRKCQRGLSPHTQLPQMLWRSPSLHHCHGKTGCERRKTSKRGTPLLEEISSPVRPPTRMEGCSISDVSMAEEGPQQGNSNVVVEEVEESMDTDEHSNIDAPAPLLDKAFLQSS